MNQLIKLILQYQNSNSDEIFEKIVNKLMNLIKFYSNKMKKIQLVYAEDKIEKYCDLY